MPLKLTAKVFKDSSNSTVVLIGQCYTIKNLNIGSPVELTNVGDSELNVKLGKLITYVEDSKNLVIETPSLILSFEKY